MRTRFRNDEETIAARYSLAQSAHLGWQELLEPLHPDWFLTITFKQPRKDVILALNAVERALKSLYTHPRYFLAAEYHQEGTVHVHGLFRWCRGCINEGDATSLWVSLFHRFGRSEVRTPILKADVVKYTTKYCTKDLTDWRIWGLNGVEKELTEVERGQERNGHA